jgi:hypothetical protein
VAISPPLHARRTAPPEIDTAGDQFSGRCGIPLVRNGVLIRRDGQVQFATEFARSVSHSLAKLEYT